MICAQLHPIRCWRAGDLRVQLAGHSCGEAQSCIHEPLVSGCSAHGGERPASKRTAHSIHQCASLSRDQARSVQRPGQAKATPAEIHGQEVFLAKADVQNVTLAPISQRTPCTVSSLAPQSMELGEVFLSLPTIITPAIAIIAVRRGSFYRIPI